MKKILVADAEPLMDELVQATLARTIPCELLAAADGTAALALARQEHPSLVVVAAELPGLSGYEVCRALKADAATRDIPVLVLTESTEREVQGYALEAEADGYLPQPFSPRDLRALVQKLVADG